MKLILIKISFIKDLSYVKEESNTTQLIVLSLGKYNDAVIAPIDLPHKPNDDTSSNLSLMYFIKNSKSYYS